MIYSREVKELMNQYFKWKRTNANKTMKEVSSYLNIDYRTYKDVENGVVKKNDEYYDKLQEYYSMYFHKDYTLFHSCMTFIPQLYNFVEYNEEEKIIEFVEELKSKIDKYKKYAYYKELYISLNIIDNYYAKKEYVQLSEMDKIISLMYLWNNELSSILLEICEKSNLNLYYNYEISDKLYENIVIRDAISKYWYAKECKMHMNYLESLQLTQELIAYFDNNQNLNKKTLVQLDEFAIYRDIDQNKALNYIPKLDIILNSNIKDTLKRNTSYSIAVFYYYQSKYEEALYYFKKSYDFGKRISCLLFIYACESRLNILQIEDKIDNKTDFYLYIQYFEKKAVNTNNLELENYIMEQLIQLLEKEKYKEPLWSLIEYELNQTVKKTRNYKKLQIFNEKMSLSIASVT